MRLAARTRFAQSLLVGPKRRPSIFAGPSAPTGKAVLCIVGLSSRSYSVKNRDHAVV